jgi:hypothetical protein
MLTTHIYAILHSHASFFKQAIVYQSGVQIALHSVCAYMCAMVYRSLTKQSMATSSGTSAAGARLGWCTHRRMRRLCHHQVLPHHRRHLA